MQCSGSSDPNADHDAHIQGPTKVDQGGEEKTPHISIAPKSAVAIVPPKKVRARHQLSAAGSTNAA